MSVVLIKGQPVNLRMGGHEANHWTPASAEREHEVAAEHDSWCQGCDVVRRLRDMRWSHGLFLCRHCWHELGVEPAQRQRALEAVCDVPVPAA